MARRPLVLAVLLLLAAPGCTPQKGQPDGGVDGGMGKECTVANEAKKCNDGDPCTVDTCVNGYCTWTRPKPTIKLLARIPTAGPASGLYYPASDHILVASGKGGVETFDLTPLPKKAPKRLTLRKTAQPAIGVNEASDAVIAIEGLAGLEVFPRTGNVTTAEGSYQGSDRILGVGRTQTYVVAFTFGKGLEILDASDWTNLTLIDRADTPGRAYDGVLWNNDILVADGLSGIDAVDFSDPTKAKLDPNFTPLPTEGRALHITRRGNLVLLAEDGAGMGVFDLGAKGGPARIATLHLPGPAKDLRMITTRTIAIADGSSGLVLASLIDRKKPTIWFVKSLPAPAVAIANYGQRIAVAMGAKGVGLYDLACTGK